MSGKKIIIQKELWRFVERIDETRTKAGAMVVMKREQRRGEKRGGEGRKIG